MAKDPIAQLEVIKKVSQQGKPVFDCFRLLYKEELWLHACSQLLPGKNNIEKRAFLLKEIRSLIKNLSEGTFHRSFFHSFGYRKIGKEPPFRDLLLLETMRLLLEAVYKQHFSCPENEFAKNSPKKTLIKVVKSFQKMTWCIKGEMNTDPLNTEVLGRIISRSVHDRRFLYLIKKAISSRILDHKQTLPFRSLLEQIYFHQLDQWITICIKSFIAGKDGTGKRIRRAKYIRYGREFVIGVGGTKQEATQFMKEIEDFLMKELAVRNPQNSLALSHLEKPVPFLNYEFCLSEKCKGNDKPQTEKLLEGQKESDVFSPGKIILLLPAEKLSEFARMKGYGCLETGVSHHRKKLLHLPEDDILAIYNDELTKFASYYKLAVNFHHLDKLFFLARGSFVKTIAAKRRSTAKQAAKHLRKKGLSVVSRRAVYFERGTYGSEGGKETC